LSRLVAVIDRNAPSIEGDGEEQLALEPLADKWRSFGWRVTTCDGHDFGSLCPALDRALAGKGVRPHVVIANTVKGRGVHFMEGRAAWHRGALDSVQRDAALADIRAGKTKRRSILRLVARKGDA
jgi:transketolase